MKIVVTSDTHGHKEILNRIVEENRDAELFLHAGDSQISFSEIFPFKAVKGNCDIGSEYPTEMIINTPYGDLYMTCLLYTSIFYDLKENDVLVNQYNGEIKINDNLAEILKDVLVTREGYKFLGWSLDGTNLIDHNTVVESKEVKVIPIFTKLS